MSQLRVGLGLILTGIFLTRIAVHFSGAAPNTNPDQIWHGMSGGLQALVLASFCLTAYGAWKSLKSIVGRLLN
jgi:hypothetical protein